MSGGFFRGTSADQDTRFSNKQAKLLKSQKFAPELEHLVDMTKVKMDVIKPWIATRATEFLGFEDEVLINFIYGLLDGKGVDGKQIQIQLTGFMEKNTGKFMKELWSLLLSAQKNVSGVPQQFLDAKEEETKKKKAETDRITQEIQKRKEKEKEGRELEREKQNRMDGEADISRSPNAVYHLKQSRPRASSVHPEEGREVDEGHGLRAKNKHSKSPHSNGHSPSSRRPSATRSRSKSFSKSRSHSEEHDKSRSPSVPSRSKRHSISPEREYRSSPRQSISPKRRYQSPPRRSISPHHRRSPRNQSPSSRRSPHSRRRSQSHSRHGSPSLRRRSPHARRRSPLSQRRRSPSPMRHRSPSPLRHQSPARVPRRSPSPSWHKTHSLRNRSLSPARRRSPSPLRRRSPRPRSPKHERRSPLRSPRRIRSPYRSPSYRSRRSSSRVRDSRINGVESRRYRSDYVSERTLEKRSPVHHASEREAAKHTDLGRRGSDSISRQLPISIRSPQRDSRDRIDIRNRVPISPVPPQKAQDQLESPTFMQKMNPRENRSSSESPVKHTRGRMARHDSPESSREQQTSHAREDARHKTDSSHKKSKYPPADVSQKKSPAKGFRPEVYSPDRLTQNQSATVKDREQRSDVDLPERHIQQVSYLSEEIEYGPGKVGGERCSVDNVHDGHPSNKQVARNASSDGRRHNEQSLKSNYMEGYGFDDQKRHQLESDECSEPHYETGFGQQSRKKVDQSSLIGTSGSDSEESDAYKNQNMESQRRKKPDHRKRDFNENAEYDSQIEDRKEAKRRKKDEKRVHKEERRQRREERHRRRFEHRASKLKAKAVDTVAPPSDFENHHIHADESDGDVAVMRNSHRSDAEESEQKKLEIELRKKALESLKAKKAISH